MELEALQFMLEVYLWKWRYYSWCWRNAFEIGGIYLELEVLELMFVGIYLELETL